jgi:hypothetical protein
MDMKGNNISSIEFKKNQKTKPTKPQMTSNRSRTEKNIPSSHSESNVNYSSESKPLEVSGVSSHEAKENRYGTRSKPNEKLLKPSSDSKQNASETMSQRKYSTENLAEVDNPLIKKSSYAENVRSKRQKIDPGEVVEYQSQKSDPHLSAYGEPVSMHSSVLSSSSKTNKSNRMEIPPIPKIQQNNFFEEDKEVGYRIMDVEMRDDKIDEFDDFTEQQKEYINSVLEEKLRNQREKLITYFQNMQIEMIRQFQIQQLELEQDIEDVIEAKNRSKFINKFRDDADH